MFDHRGWNQVSHAHLSPQEKPNLSARYIVLYKLLDDVDVILPLLQIGQRPVEVGTRPFDDECTIAS